MSKIGLEIVILCGIIFCIGLFQTAKAAEVKPPDIDVPDEGFTIVLSAPTSENYQLVKFSNGRKGNRHKEVLQGLTVSLPKNTKVDFRVDQVNTVLYDVKITIEGVSPQAESESKEPIKLERGAAVGLIQEAKTIIESRSQPGETGAENALDYLKSKVEAVEKLQVELKELLYETEKPLFYNNPADNFARIITEAKKYAKKIPDMQSGTSQEIRNDALEAIQKAYEACAKVDKTSLVHLPKDLSKTSNAIAAVFVKTADKLGEIETADWVKEDTQNRLLTNQIKYTCVFTPKEEYPNLKSTPPRVVTVVPTTDLSGIKATVGTFISDLSDDNYVNINGKIGRGRQDQFSTSFGLLIHVPFWSHNFRNFRGALALSGGGALGNISTIDGNLALGPVPVTLGGSLLLAGPTSDSLLSITGGAILKPVSRLNDYCVGDPYPPAPQTLTTRVNKFSWFCAVTFSYSLFDQLGFKSTIATRE